MLGFLLTILAILVIPMGVAILFSMASSDDDKAAEGFGYGFLLGLAAPAAVLICAGVVYTTKEINTAIDERFEQKFTQQTESQMEETVLEEL